jgi:hypothetical protein
MLVKLIKFYLNGFEELFLDIIYRIIFGFFIASLLGMIILFVAYALGY